MMTLIPRFFTGKDKPLVPSAQADGSKTQLEIECVASVARFADSGSLSGVIPKLRSLRFAHPGLNSAAAPRLVVANISKLNMLGNMVGSSRVQPKIFWVAVYREVEKPVNEGMIYLMNLFSIKGACVSACFRKAECHEEVSSGIGTHETRSSATSSRPASVAAPCDRLRV